MLIEPQDVAKLLGVSGCLLSMAVIVSISLSGVLRRRFEGIRLDADIPTYELAARGRCIKPFLSHCPHSAPGWRII
jgi:hypothetical protein